MDQLKDRLKNLFSHLKQLALRGFEIFKENNMSVFSGYAALFIVTSVFPFIILIISIVNRLPGYSADDVADILFQILPDLGAIKDLIVSLIENLQSQSGGLLASAAAVTTLGSASKGVAAIQKGLNQLDRKKEKRETKNGDKSRIKEKGEGSFTGSFFTLHSSSFICICPFNEHSLFLQALYTWHTYPSDSLCIVLPLCADNFVKMSTEYRQLSQRI